MYHQHIASSSKATSAMIDIQQYTSAREVLSKVDFSHREIEANTILPHLIKLCHQKSYVYPPSWSSSRSWTPDMWLVLSTISPGQTSGMVDFVLSCTNGPLGSYPIFIWSSRPVTYLSREFIQLRLNLLAERLKYSLPSSRRVYSVFAPKIIAQAFSKAWSTQACTIPVEEPYYHATQSTVSIESLRWQDDSSIRHGAPRHTLRPAVSGDAMGVAYLCYEFAATNDPFIQDEESALNEAHHLIKSGQVYVCDVGGQITSMVAITRTSGNVATITKVVTHPKYVRQGWAKRLVRDVCKRLLIDEHKSRVALYVSIGNTAAEATYHACGFAGLFGHPSEPDRDAEWLEIGFHDSDLGHW